MALSYTGSTDETTQGTAAFPTTGSLQLWVFPTWSQTDGIWHDFFAIFDGTNAQFQALKFSDNSLYFGWIDATNTASRVVVTSGNYTLNQNAWNHFVFAWTANGSSNLYLNNTNIGSIGTTDRTWNTNGITRHIGNWAAGTHPVSGRLAEYAVWSGIALSSTDVSTLYNSGSNSGLALEVQSASLVDYIPLWGVGTDGERNEVSGGTDGSNTGTTHANHCPVKLYVQQSTNNHTASSNNFSLSFSSLPAVNNTVLVRVGGTGAGAVSPTCSDNQGNTYTQSYFVQDGTNEWVAEFYAKVTTSSGTFTVTVASGGTAATMELAIAEVYPTLFLDKKSTSTGSGTTATPGSVTTSNAPQLLSAVVSQPSGFLAPARPSLYGSDDRDATVLPFGSFLRSVGATLSINPSATTNNVAWAMGQAAYSITALGTPRPPFIIMPPEPYFHEDW